MNAISKINNHSPFCVIYTLDNNTLIHHYLPSTNIYGKTTSLKVKTRKTVNSLEGIKLTFIYK